MYFCEELSRKIQDNGMLFEEALEESERLDEGYKRYKMRYVGTRKDYKIHDRNPYIVALDADYNVDNKGKSILGVNLNYYQGDKKKMIKDINRVDNAHGFLGFDTMMNAEKLFNKKNYSGLSKERRKERYKLFKKNFPQLQKFIRRYKYKAPGAEQHEKDAKASIKALDRSDRRNAKRFYDDVASREGGIHDKKRVVRKKYNKDHTEDPGK